jgi:probable phosphoglycerate mutase
MKRIILIRAGKTEFDQQGRILGTLDVPLTDEGSSEVGDLVQQIRDYAIEFVYTAPCESAEQTAHQIAQSLSVKSKTFEQLTNIDHGLWQGMLVDEVKRKQPKVFKKWQEEPLTVCPPEGEMIADARQRIEACVAKMIKKNKYETIGLVAPEPLAGLIASVLRNKEVGEGWHTNGTGPAWEVIEIEPAALIGT